MAPLRDIPIEIIECVANCMVSIEDFTTFGCVCKSWQSIILDIIKNRPKQFSPCIMLPTYEYEPPQQFQKFYSLSHQKYLHIRLSETAGRNCWGSPFGWLVTFGPDGDIHLLNPFTRIQLPLPSKSTDLHQPHFGRSPDIMDDFVLSAAPEPDQTCLVLAICRGPMDFVVARPGDEAWTSVSTGPHDFWVSGIFYSGEFYLCTNERLLVIKNINSLHPKVKRIATLPARSHLNAFHLPYLVEMSGDLLYVQRAVHEREEGQELLPGEFVQPTFCFDVHKVNFRERSWTKLSGLGDYALFLGSNTFLAMSTANYPRFKRNSVYFTTHYSGAYDMGVYDFETDTVDSICVGGYEVSEFSWPLFIMPSL